jgi:hypothetical protein
MAQMAFAEHHDMIEAFSFTTLARLMIARMEPAVRGTRAQSGMFIALDPGKRLSRDLLRNQLRSHWPL